MSSFQSMPAMIIGAPIVWQGFPLGQPIDGLTTLAGMKEKRERTPFGERLHKARKHAKLTQAQLAKAAGVAQSTLAELEYDGDASMAAVRIANACGVRPLWLTDGEGEMVDRITWPFSRVQKDQILALNDDDRSFVEGKLSAALEQIGNPSPEDLQRFKEAHQARVKPSKSRRSA